MHPIPGCLGDAVRMQLFLPWAEVTMLQCQLHAESAQVVFLSTAHWICCLSMVNM